MKKEIANISALQAGKVAAVLYFIMTLPFILIFLAMAPFMPGESSFLTKGFMLLAPVFYAVFGAIFTIIGALVYNLVARMVGGFQFTVVEVKAA